MHILLAYIKFLWRSTNEHGVHSPFIYSLVTKCFYDRSNHAPYKIIRDYRKELLLTKQKISVTDFGAGSKVFTSSEREVSKMVKKVSISQKRAKLLNRLVRYLDVQNALELGTSLGVGTAALAAGNTVNVTTIEGCPQTAAVAAKALRKFGLENIDLRVGKFETFLKNPEFLNSIEVTHSRQFKTESSDSITPDFEYRTKFDLIYFDGNHQKNTTLEYFLKLLPTTHNDSVFIFDDIHWSAGMEEAWKEIKEHPSVKVTVDTFFWGFVFFRKEQEKEHFVIRI